MKKIPFLVAGLMLLVLITSALCYGETIIPKEVKNSNDSKSITISSSPELETLTTSWIDAYSKLNPSVKIIKSETNTGDLTLVSDRNKESYTNQWKIVVGHDAIVPVINSMNPYLKELSKTGISSDKLSQLITNPENQNWGFIQVDKANTPIHIYYIEDEGLKTAIASFINAENVQIAGTAVTNADELINAIHNDIYAIGFCRLPDVLIPATNSFKENIVLLPIDKNRNGRLDSFENIYQNPESFMRGVWVGKYPNDLCQNIYAVAQQKPVNKVEIAFLEWIMSEGQQYLNKGGYTILSSYQTRSNIDSITGTSIAIVQPERQMPLTLWVLIITGVILVTFIIATVIRIRKTNRSIALTPEVVISNALNPNIIDAPLGLHYDKTHTWAFMEKNGIVRIGIDDFLQHLTGKITRIKMKEPGDSIRKGEKILTLVKDGKQLDLYAPVSGIIKEQNQILLDNSSLINTSPYNEGWVYMIIPKNWARETEFLFLVDKYKVWLEDEFSRLKEFFTNSIRSNSSAYAHIVLQDGGELTDNVLADMEPEVWEDFQTRFIDISK
ncbi:MAG: hypothetical protein ACM3PX_10995 [Omnitrophica WOR_2 bacterium]